MMKMKMVIGTKLEERSVRHRRPVSPSTTPAISGGPRYPHRLAPLLLLLLLALLWSTIHPSSGQHGSPLWRFYRRRACGL